VEKVKRLFEFWLPPLIWGLLIFLSSSRPSVVVSKIYWPDFMVKKTAHMIEYGILFTLFYRALRSSFEKKELLKLALFAFLLTFFYAISDEYHQTFIPGRQGLPRDILIDGFGAVLAWGGIWKLLPKAPKRLQHWAKRLQIN
jgi:hypothetical protein